MRKPLLLAVFAIASASAFAQVGIGTSTPNSHAVLDLQSPGHNQGLFVPALSTTQRTASSLTSVLAASDNGMLVYDSDEKKFYYWKDTAWQPLQDGADAGAGTVTNINTGTGLSGGPIVSTGTISLANTSVTPAAYGDGTHVGQFTVDAQGRITNASSVLVTGATNFSGTLAGDVTGTQGATSVTKIQGNAVSTTAPTNNQVLKWNGTNWLPSPDANSGGTLTNIITGTGLAGGPITTTGTISLANTAVTAATYGDATHVAQIAVDAQGRITNASSVTITGAAPTGSAGGDLSGLFPNPTVSKIQGSAVSATAPTANQILKWNGTSWLPSADANSGGTVTNIVTGTGLSGGPISATGTIALANTAVTASTYGDATHVGQFTVDAQGRITNASSVTITGAAPTGSAGGDLSGLFPNPTVSKIQGSAVSATAPTANQILKWNGSSWAPSVDANSGGTVTNIATGTGLTGGPISATGTIALANTAVTAAMYGDGTHVGQFTVDAQGRITNASSVLVTGATNFSGALAGDVTGTQAATLVTKIQGSAVSATAPTANQILKWSGTNWLPSADANSGGTVTNIATGTGLTGGPISATGTIALANTAVTAATYGDGTHVGQFTVDAQGRITNASSVLVTGATNFSGALTGDVTGTQAATLVTKIQGSAVSATAPTANQILKWSGTNWLPSPDANSGGTVTNIATGTGLTGGPISATGTIALANTAVAAATYGDATHVGQFTVDAQGRITNASSVLLSATNFTGVLAGDVTGTQAATLVTKLQGSAVSSTAPTASQVLKWNGTSWLPSPDANSGGTVTNIATGTGLTGGPISATGTIALANTAVTAATYGDGTHVGQFTVDAQGRITNASSVLVSGATNFTGTLTGDVSGTQAATVIGAGKVTTTHVLDLTLVDADISTTAAIVDSKLATISTAGKVSGNAITSGTISGVATINTNGSIHSNKSLSATNSIPGNVISSNNGLDGGTAISGIAASTNGGYGVYGQGNGITIGRTTTYSQGVFGVNAFSGASGYLGGQYGVSGTDVKGTGVSGDGVTGLSGSGTFVGVYGSATGNGVYGVYGFVTGAGNYGVYSSGQAGGTTGWVAASDLRFKKNISPLTGSLNKILHLQGVSYDWRLDEFPDKHFVETRDIGVIAQEIKEVIPEVVFKDGRGYYSVSYEKIVPVLIEAIKEQEKKIVDQEARITELEKITTRFSELEALLKEHASKSTQTASKK